MPAYRRYYRRRGYRRKNRQVAVRPRPSKYWQYANTAYQAWRMGKMALSLLNTEKKFFDTNSTGSTSTTWQHFILTQIPQGDTEKSRDGSQVRLKSLQIRGQIVSNVSAPTNGNRVKLVLVKQKSNHAIQADSIYLGGIDSLRNMNSTGDFNVLWERTFILDHDTRPRHQVDKYFRLNQLVKWKTASTSVEAGHLYLFIIGDDATNTCAFDFNTRVRYIDN